MFFRFQKAWNQKNMHSGLSRRSLTKADQSAGISPYDCPAVIINIFIIDNKLSMLLTEAPKGIYEQYARS
jgi:hypothetical protein